MLLSLRKNGQEESRLLNLRRLRSSRYVGGHLFHQNTGKSSNIKNFGGGLRGPKILHAEILCVSYLHVTFPAKERLAYNGLRDVVLWSGAFGWEILDFLSVASLGMTSSDFLLCRHSPLNISANVVNKGRHAPLNISANAVNRGSYIQGPKRNPKTQKSHEQYQRNF